MSIIGKLYLEYDENRIPSVTKVKVPVDKN